MKRRREKRLLKGCVRFVIGFVFLVALSLFDWEHTRWISLFGLGTVVLSSLVLICLIHTLCHYWKSQ